MTASHELTRRANAFRARGAFSSAITRVGQAALDVIFPPSCLACARMVDHSAGLCPACWRAMRFIERPFCERLGTPFPADLGPGLLSPEAIARPPAYARARAVARFEDGPARLLVHRLKYGDRTELARPLGSWMARAGADLIAETDLIVPIPLHRTRLWRRQFNQAALLAAQISRKSRLPWHADLLARIRPTPSQVGMTRSQRQDNVAGAFRLRDGAATSIRGRRVLLIDDVLTTGATLDAAARVLLRGGASAVEVLVFARVVTES